MAGNHSWIEFVTLMVASVSAAGLHVLRGGEGRSGNGLGIVVAGLWSSLAGGASRLKVPACSGVAGPDGSRASGPKQLLLGGVCSSLTLLVEGFWALPVFALQILIKRSWSCPQER